MVTDCKETGIQLCTSLVALWNECDMAEGFGYREASPSRRAEVSSIQDFAHVRKVAMKWHVDPLHSAGSVFC